IWDLTRQLWSFKYSYWPTLNWGLVLGCNVVKLRSEMGVVLTEKGRLFAILVAVAWQQIWNLHVNRVITNPDSILTDVMVPNQRLKDINGALQRD
ncbi:hypothetical protein B0H19DRAFT_936169, partial [Mycena capillaripes]